MGYNYSRSVGIPKGINGMKPNSTRLLGFVRKKQVKIYRDIFNLFHTYLGINCNFVSADNYSEWHTLFFARALRLPHHFETYFGRVEDVGPYNHAHFDRVRKTKRFVLGKHRGFYELFTPIVSGG